MKGLSARALAKLTNPETDCEARVYRGSRDITCQADGENTLAGLPPHSDPEREPIPQALGSEPCSRDLGGARGRPELASSSSGLVRTTSRRRNLPEREVQQNAPAASDELLREPRQQAFASAARGRRRYRCCPCRGSLRADSGGGHAHLRALSPVVPPRLCSLKNSFPRTTPNGGMASSPSCL